MTTPLLVSDLQRDEGLRLTAYPDPISHGEPWTLGYGRAHGISPGQTCTAEQALEWLNQDIATAEASLDAHLSWWRTLDDVRQDSLCNMVFNMGINGLLGFHNMLADLLANDYDGAANEALDSAWAVQTGQRAQRLAYMIRTGTRKA